MKALEPIQQSASGSQELPARFRGILVYEDFHTGKRAKDVFDRLLFQIEIPAKVYLSLWRFDLLQNLEVNRRAAHQAAAADVIVLSVHGTRDLPPEVDLWLAGWLGDSHRARHSALILSLDREYHEWSAEARILASLRTRIESAGIDLIPHYSAAKTDSGGGSWGRPEVMSLLAEEALQHTGSFKHWGLNE